MSHKIIAGFEKDGEEVVVVKKENGRYDVIEKGEVVQPNHDAEGIIRYLSHVAHGLYFKIEKMEAENKDT